MVESLIVTFCVTFAASLPYLHVGCHLENDDVGDHSFVLVRGRRPAPVHRNRESIRPLPRIRLNVTVARRGERGDQGAGEAAGVKSVRRSCETSDAGVSEL